MEVVSESPSYLPALEVADSIDKGWARGGVE